MKNVDKTLIFPLSGIIFFFLAFILVNGSENKLIVGGLILLYLGIMSLFDDETRNKGLSIYFGIFTITLGGLALLTAYLLPQSINLFIIIFLIMIFLEWILLYFFGPKMWFKNLLFIMFTPIVSLTIWNILSDSFKTGVNQLASINWVLLIFSVIVIVMIYNSSTSFFSKIFPKSSKLRKMSTNKSSLWFLVIVVIVLFIGFFYGGLGFNEVLEFWSNPYVIFITLVILIFNILSK